jgi:hypothetical protein
MSSRAEQRASQPQFKRKSKRFKKDGTPYKPRKGWGPYRSVPNERAAAFNLQLDVQNLQQEVHNMTAMRDILRTKILRQPHSPEGSLVQAVKEYFQIFRSGAVQDETEGRPLLVNDRYRDQRKYMFNFVDPDVDVGNEVHGPEHMMYQMDMYSTLIRWIRITMHSFDVVQAEDSVVVRTNATLRFRVLRATVDKIFPHIMANEWFVSQLVGKETEPSVAITFYFNAEGKCCKFAADMNFLGAFASIVKDPAIVEMLFSRALIADNCQLGMLDRPPVLDEDEEKAAPPPSTCTTFSRAQEDERSSLVGDATELRSALPAARPHGAGQTGESPQAPACISVPEPWPRDVETACLRVVEEYYAVFRHGYQLQDDTATAPQRNFLLNRFVPSTGYGHRSSAECAAERWRNLSECFDVLGFHQKSVVSVEYHRHVGTCVISSSSRYTLRVTPDTMLSVFPHIPAHSQLHAALQGEVLVVPSQIYFSIDVNSGRICHMEERMDFVAAMAKLAANGQELQFVLSQAKLVLDGVSCRKGQSKSPSCQLSGDPERNYQRSTTNKEASVRTGTRTMRISGILS